MGYVRLKLLERIPVGYSSVFEEEDGLDAPSHPYMLRCGDGNAAFAVLVCGEDAQGPYGYNLAYAKKVDGVWFRWVFPTAGKKGEWVEDADPQHGLAGALALEDRIRELSEGMTQDEREAALGASLIDREAAVPFGKYRGRTVGELMDEDWRYFIWMTGKEDFVKEILK